MLTKILTALLIGAIITRVLLAGQWKSLGRWWKRCVDLAFVVIVVIYGVQLSVLALR